MLGHIMKGRLFLFALAGSLLTCLSPAFAQAGERVLAPGATLSGALGPEETATSYVFDATAGTRAAVTAASGEAALALLISDANGSAVARAVDDAAVGAAQVDNLLLTAGGRYFVVVYFAPESAAVSAAFDLTLAFDAPAEATAAVPTPDASAEAAEPVPAQILIAEIGRAHV